MNKYFALLFVMGLSFSLQAQEDTATTTSDDTTSKEEAEMMKNKNGYVIFPEKGDWALGFDATSLLEYAGNLFNSSNTAPTADFTGNSQAVYGKYYKDRTTAYRAKARIGVSTVTDKMLYDTTANNTWKNPLEDRKKTNTTDLYLSIGMEKRKGTWRIQGFYGAEATMNFSTEKVIYQYAEQLSQDHTEHTTNFSQEKGLLIDDPADTFSFGVRGFLGIEVFIFPKLSLGAEYGWGLAYEFAGTGEQVIEEWNASQSVVETTTVPAGGESGFIVDTDNNGGSIMILYHF